MEIIQTSQHFFSLFASSPIGPETQYIGAVGNFIAAVLQTAGLYGQSDVLQFYREALTSLAAFFYFVVIVGALGSVALFGNYKGAAYFLIAPLLFYSMLTGVTTATPTSIRTGNRIVDDAAEKQRKILSIYLESGSDVYTRDLQLSWFFVAYDNLITNITQNIIAVLLDEENKADIKNVARERAFVEIFATQTVNSNLMELISLATIGQCQEPIAKYMEAGNPKLREAEAGTPQAAERDQIIGKANSLMNINSVRLDGKLKAALSSVGTDPKLSQLGFLKDTQTWNGMLNKEINSCYDVWTFLQIFSLLEAANVFEQFEQRGLDGAEMAEQPNWEEVVADIKKVMAGDVAEADIERAAVEVLSMNLFKNAIRGTAHSNMMGQLHEHLPFDTDKRLFDDLFAGFYSAEGQGALSKLAFFTGVIPYLQGLLLFLLATSFPFFCVFLVVPQRLGSFITWMSLWLWVKSWDVGFALLQVVREILWDWLGRAATPYLSVDLPLIARPDQLPSGGTNSVYQPGDMVIQTKYTAIDWGDPSAIFHAIAKADPLANVNTYYILIALLTMSVPAITAQLCAGASELFDAFKGSFSDAAERFGQVSKNYASQASVNRLDILMEQKGHAYAMNEVRKFLKSEGASDSVASQIMKGLQNSQDALSMQYANRGDASLAMAAQGRYSAARADYHYSNGNMDDALLRGLGNGRTSLWSAGMDSLYRQQDNFLLSDPNMARDPKFGYLGVFADPGPGWSKEGSSIGSTPGEGPSGGDLTNKGDGGGPDGGGD